MVSGSGFFQSLLLSPRNMPLYKADEDGKVDLGSTTEGRKTKDV